jgi:4-hydroxy-tetrahydrodipicolinate synthase
MKLPLRGIYPPVITPMLGYEQLDRQGVVNLVEHLIQGGVHGLFLLGTNGEAPSLSYKLRKEFLKLACEQVKGRVPVLVAITDASLAGALEMAEYAKEVGADAVVFAPPFYYPIGEDEMNGYVEHIASKLPLPFLLYNMPTHTKVNISIDTIKRAKELGAIGLKDSSGNLTYIYNAIEEFKSDPDFAIFAGAEQFLPETIINGGNGAVAGGANVFPELFVKLYDASVAKDMAQIAVLRDKMLQIHKTMYTVGTSFSRITMSFKTALKSMGVINSDYMAEPLKQFTGKEREQIEFHLANLKKIM